MKLIVLLLVVVCILPALAICLDPGTIVMGNRRFKSAHYHGRIGIVMADMTDVKEGRLPVIFWMDMSNEEPFFPKSVSVRSDCLSLYSEVLAGKVPEALVYPCPTEAVERLIVHQAALTSVHKSLQLYFKLIAALYRSYQTSPEGSKKVEQHYKIRLIGAVIRNGYEPQTVLDAAIYLMPAFRVTRFEQDEYDSSKWNKPVGPLVDWLNARVEDCSKKYGENEGRRHIFAWIKHNRNDPSIQDYHACLTEFIHSMETMTERLKAWWWDLIQDVKQDDVTISPSTQN